MTDGLPLRVYISPMAGRLETFRKKNESLRILYLQFFLNEIAVFSVYKGAGEILREILSSRIRTKSGGACSIGTRKGVSGSGSPRDRNGVENGGREDATFLRPPW